LRRVLSSYREFFNGLRPHQGLGNQIPACLAGDQARRAGTDVWSLSEPKVDCTDFLGCLLKSYSLAAQRVTSRRDEGREARWHYALAALLW